LKSRARRIDHPATRRSVSVDDADILFSRTGLGFPDPAGFCFAAP